jgi:hypothetical protein
MSDLTMGVHAIQSAMEYVASQKEWEDFYDEKKGQDTLANRTLLIPHISSKDKYLHAILKKIKTDYPLEIQEVSEEEMTKIMKEKDKTKAYLIMSPVSRYFFEGWIVDVGTGQILVRGDAEAKIEYNDIKGTLFENFKILESLKN